MQKRPLRPYQNVPKVRPLVSPRAKVGLIGGAGLLAVVTLIIAIPGALKDTLEFRDKYILPSPAKAPDVRPSVAPTPIASPTAVAIPAPTPSPPQAVTREVVRIERVEVAVPFERSTPAPLPSPTPSPSPTFVKAAEPALDYRYLLTDTSFRNATAFDQRRKRSYAFDSSCGSANVQFDNGSSQGRSLRIFSHIEDNIDTFYIGVGGSHTVRYTHKGGNGNFLFIVDANTNNLVFAIWVYDCKDKGTFRKTGVIVKGNMSGVFVNPPSK